MGADFLEGDFDLPAPDEPSDDIARMNVGVGCEEGLGLKLARRIGTSLMPLRYHSAVPLAISTRRLVRPYH